MKNPFKGLLNSDTNQLGFQSTLTTRHLVPDPKGNVINQYGQRCREIKEDRRESHKMVTTAFCVLVAADLVAAQSNYHNFFYHASGTGTTAEAITDTTLVTETDRTAGNQAVTGSPAVIYKSVATTTYGSTKAITEHGLLNAAAVGTLMDRSVFAAVNVVNGEQIEFTYQITFVSGS